MIIEQNEPNIIPLPPHQRFVQFEHRTLVVHSYKADEDNEEHGHLIVSSIIGLSLASEQNLSLLKKKHLIYWNFQDKMIFPSSNEVLFLFIHFMNYNNENLLLRKIQDLL